MSGAPHPRVADLFKDSADLVLRTAWRITGRAEDAEDVLQGVFVQLLSSPSRWPDNPRAYVHRAAVNGALDVLRRRRRRAEMLEGDAAEERQPQVPGPSVADRMATDEMADRVRDALANLSPLEAEVFTLRCFEDMDNVEIARLLDKTPNHVGVTLHAARAKLKKALARGDRPSSIPSAGAGNGPRPGARS